MVYRKLWWTLGQEGHRKINSHEERIEQTSSSWNAPLCWTDDRVLRRCDIESSEKGCWASREAKIVVCTMYMPKPTICSNSLCAAAICFAEQSRARAETQTVTMQRWCNKAINQSLLQARTTIPPCYLSGPNYVANAPQRVVYMGKNLRFLWEDTIAIQRNDARRAVEGSVSAYPDGSCSW